MDPFTIALATFGIQKLRGFAAIQPKIKIPNGFPINRPAKTSQVASPIAEKATPAFIKPKKNNINSTGTFKLCSISLSKSC